MRSNQLAEAGQEVTQALTGVTDVNVIGSEEQVRTQADLLLSA